LKLKKRVLSIWDGFVNEKTKCLDEKRKIVDSSKRKSPKTNIFEEIEEMSCRGKAGEGERERVRFKAL